MNPGVYPGLPMASYMRADAVGASVLRALLDECARAAWFCSSLNPQRVDDPSDASDAGTIAHEILLEGTRDCVCAVDPRDHPAEKTNAIPKGWTNKSIKAARDQARAAGKIPVLVDDLRAIEGMVESAEAFIESLATTEPAVWQAFQRDGGDSELSIFWNDPTGVACKMRPDRISADRRIVIDAKFVTRSAQPERFARTHLIGDSYYVGAAFYRRGIARTFGVEDADYFYLVVEQQPPYLCSLVGVDPATMELGAEKVSAALRDWSRCVARNEWPAYPARACYLELPQFELARWQERQASGDWRVLFPELAAKVGA